MSDSFVTVAAAAEAGVAQRAAAAAAPNADDALARRVNYEILNRRNDNIMGGFLTPKSDLI